MKFRFKTAQWDQTIRDGGVGEIIGRDWESHQCGLVEAIDRGEFPRWQFYLEIMSEAEAGWTAFNPFDLTKIWPHAESRLIEVSMLELNHNAENYLTEVEQATFWVANLVPGIGLSPDKILQMRAVSNVDAQWYDLGANPQARLVYEPRCASMEIAVAR